MTTYVDADLHDPDLIVSDARNVLNFDQPVAVMFMGVLGYVAGFDGMRSIVARVMAAVRSGSYLALRDGTATGETVVEGGAKLAETGAVPYHLRSPEELGRCFEGTELVAPGLLPIAQWWPDFAESGTAAPIDADGADWRARWESLKTEVTPEAAVRIPRPESQPAERPRRLLPLAAGLVVLGVGVLIAMLRIFSLSSSAENGESGSTEPLVKGDHSRFIRDVTVPDESRVRVGEEFVKVWEIMNAGTVTWRGRYLQREDLPVSPDTCRTAERVPIGDTLPNERVMISVQVTAPDEPTTCKIDWKMVDEQGRQFLPNSRPLFFLLHVVAP